MNFTKYYIYIQILDQLWDYSCSGELKMYFSQLYLRFDILSQFNNNKSNKIKYLMEFLTQSSNVGKLPQKGIAQVLKGEKRVKELFQHKQQMTKACSLNQNLEIVIKDNEVGQISQKKDGQVKSLRFYKYLFVGIIIVQFSIISAIILIQYFSSKIELIPCILLFFFVFLLNFISIATAFNVQTVFCEQILNKVQEKADANKQDACQVGTVLKIHQQMCKRDNAKTKKVQFTNIEPVQQQCTQQTIKKQVDELTNQRQKINIIAFGTKKKLIFAFKAVNVVFDITISSMSLLYFEGNWDGIHKIIITLSIFMYIVSIGSCFLTFLFLNSINKYINRIKDKVQIGQKNSLHHQQKSKVSIEQLPQSNQHQRRNSLSIQRSLKCPKETQGEVPIQKSQKCSSKFQSQAQRQIENGCKQLTKRSVLKNKLKKSSMNDISSHQTMQRRKVQINSKKIQYFQYCQISPSHSMVEQQHNRNTLANKYKFNLQRLSSKQKKMEFEENILKNKILLRQKKIKSEICLSGKGMTGSAGSDSCRADYFC